MEEIDRPVMGRSTGVDQDKEVVPKRKLGGKAGPRSRSSSAKLDSGRDVQVVRDSSSEEEVKAKTRKVSREKEKEQEQGVQMEEGGDSEASVEMTEVEKEELKGKKKKKDKRERKGESKAALPSKSCVEAVIDVGVRRSTAQLKTTEAATVMAGLSGLMSEIREQLIDNFVQKEKARVVLRQVAQMETIALGLLVELERQKGVNEGLVKAGVREVAQGGTATNTEEWPAIQPIRKVVRQPIPAPVVVAAAKPRPPPKVTYAVVIKADAVEGQEKMTTDRVKEIALKAGQAAAKEVRVKAVKKLKDGVRIEVPTAEELEKVKAIKGFTEAGLTLSVPQPPLPRMVIFDVPMGMENKEIRDEIVRKNLVPLLNAEEIEQVKVIRRHREVRGCINIVVEMPEKAKECLLSIGKVFLQWLYLNCKEDEEMPRCYKCAGYGHFSGSCKAKGMLCHKCGSADHLAAACTGEAAQCRNCKLRGMPANHSVFARSCPVYQQVLEMSRHAE